MLLTYYFSQMLAKHGPPLLDLAKFGSPLPHIKTIHQPTPVMISERSKYSNGIVKHFKEITLIIDNIFVTYIFFGLINVRG